VFKTLVVIAVGFLPSLFSLWVIRKNRLRTHLRLRQAAMNPRTQGRQNSRTEIGDSLSSPLRDRYYLDGVGYLIGDISCQYNARSGHIRCAVNPTGPCEGCRYYESRKMSVFSG
jgi:Family of unknown function (DUF6464)